MDITTKHRERLDQLAKAYAQELFKDMQDPKMRGPSFNWKKFPGMVGRLVYASAFMSFSDEEFQPHYKDYAKQKAEEYAKEIYETNSRI